MFLNCINTVQKRCRLRDLCYGQHLVNKHKCWPIVIPILLQLLPVACECQNDYYSLDFLYSSRIFQENRNCKAKMRDCNNHTGTCVKTMLHVRANHQDSSPNINGSNIEKWSNQMRTQKFTHCALMVKIWCNVFSYNVPPSNENIVPHIKFGQHLCLLVLVVDHMLTID